MSAIWSEICDLIDTFLIAILNLLPDSPFTLLSQQSEFYKYIQYINWVIPLNFMVTTMEAWLSAIAIYYIYSIILRWAKAID